MHNNNLGLLLNNAFFVWLAFWFACWLWRFLQADGFGVAARAGVRETVFWLEFHVLHFVPSKR
jgi:hypothetical protein